MIYSNASGAINESFSDIWGEFVDLSNGSADDTAANRWLIGEGIPGGAIRNMQDPPAFNHPDRLISTLYVPGTANPTRENDYGGVHTNSGVNNKLCFLLTDGQTFNNQTVYGLGVNRVAALYYEVQTNLLTSSAGWAQLYQALRQAAVNLGWNTNDRNNLYRACVAVDIAAPGEHAYVDKTSTCLFSVGLPTCSNFFGPYKTVSQGVIGTQPGDILHIRTGTYNEPMPIDKILTLQAYDGPVTIGQ